MTRLIAVALPLLLVCTAAWSTPQLVYECTDADGGTSFQSSPCGLEQETVRAIDTGAHRLSEAQRASIRERGRRREAGAAELRKLAQRSRGSRRTVVLMQSRECTRAKAARDSVYRDNPKLGYGERQKLTDSIRKACR